MHTSIGHQSVPLSITTSLYDDMDAFYYIHIRQLFRVAEGAEELALAPGQAELSQESQGGDINARRTLQAQNNFLGETRNQEAIVFVLPDNFCRHTMARSHNSRQDRRDLARRKRCSEGVLFRAAQVSRIPRPYLLLNGKEVL